MQFCLYDLISKFHQYIKFHQYQQFHWNARVQYFISLDFKIIQQLYKTLENYKMLHANDFKTSCFPFNQNNLTQGKIVQIF